MTQTAEDRKKELIRRIKADLNELDSWIINELFSINQRINKIDAELTRIRNE